MLHRIILNTKNPGAQGEDGLGLDLHPDERGLDKMQDRRAESQHVLRRGETGVGRDPDDPHLSALAAPVRGRKVALPV